MDPIATRLSVYSQSSGNPGAVDPFARWEEGAGLLLEAIAADPPPTADVLDAHRDGLDAVRVEAIERGERPGLVEWSRGRVSELKDRLVEVEGGTGPVAVALAREILDEGRWLRLLLARTGRGRPSVALKDVERETLAASEMLGDGEAEPDEVVSIQLRLLEHRLTEVERQAGAVEEDGDGIAPLSRAESLSDEATRIAARLTDRPEAQHLAERAESVEADLRRRVVAEIRKAEPERSQALLGELVAFALESAEEARVLASDLPPVEAGRAVVRARRGLERVLALGRSLPGDVKLPRGRRVRRFRRRLRAEEQELGLQARLESIFGRRVVTFVENLILFLILAVVGLLLYEGLGDPSPETVETLIWIDAGICAVFLTELFTRLALVPGGRFRWFLRHLPFEFLPSIPFGLIERALLSLNVARAGRIARLMRLERLGRYVRVVRPFVRLFRVLAFLLRGLDRLVHRNSRVLNRDVLLFTAGPPAGTLLREAEASVPAGLQNHAFDILRLEIDELAGTEREREIRETLRRTARWVDRAATAVDRCEPEAPEGRTRCPAIRIEDLVTGLRRATPSTVERTLGVELTRRLARKLRWLDLPLVRQIPLIRRFAPGARGLGDGKLAARAARAAGRTVQRMYDRILAVADLTGMISGPQLLDRVGGAMARSAGRPARKLLLLGGAFLVLRGLVSLVDASGTLEGWSLTLQTYLGTPILILGGICLVAFSTGIWFRRLAGEATDFLERTAEAQYLNLLKIVKYDRLEDDLALIQQRVLEPERLLGGGRRAEPEKLAAEAARLQEDVRRVLGSGGLEEVPREWPGLDLARRQRVLGLVHDYLDGAALHRSDRKTTEQLLGNLALMNLVRRRLRLGREHRKRLKKLDLSRERGLGGPYLWFNFVTRTVAQRTAELILEYNRHACPREDVERLTFRDREALDRWIEDRMAGRSHEVEADRPFRTSFFSALHFLTAHARLELAVKERFGDRVLAALRCDRRRMIREIFGTFPLHEMRREKRILNPYELYRKHVSGFRVLLLPLTMLRLHLRGMWAFLRRFWQIVQEVRRPELASQARARGVAGFDVAMRKVGRMRGPVYRECAWIRALVDVEYLGLSVPGLASRTAPEGFEEDLDCLPMTRDWRDRFLTLRDDLWRDLRALRRQYDARGVSLEDLEPLVGHPVPDRHGAARVLRAVAVAYAADDRHCRSLLTARERIDEALQDLIEDPLSAPRRPLVLRGIDLVRRLLGLVFPRIDPLPDDLRRYLDAHPRPVEPGERRRILRAARSNHEGIRSLLRLAGSAEHVGRLEEHAWDRIREVAADHDRLDEELLTLRTVQTLAVLDVRHYRDLIWRLGEYEKDEDESPQE